MAIVENKILGGLVRHDTGNDFLCATDLVHVGNTWRRQQRRIPVSIHGWRNRVATKRLIYIIETRYGEAIISGQGRSRPTWIHPLLFINLVCFIEPNIKFDSYRWLYEIIIKYDISIVDYYNMMMGAIYENINDTANFGKSVTILDEKLRMEVGVRNWDRATPEQLSYRDEICRCIFMMCNILRNNNREAVRLGIIKARESKNQII